MRSSWRKYPTTMLCEDGTYRDVRLKYHWNDDHGWCLPKRIDGGTGIPARVYINLTTVAGCAWLQDGIYRFVGTGHNAHMVGS